MSFGSALVAAQAAGENSQRADKELVIQQHQDARAQEEADQLKKTRDMIQAGARKYTGPDDYDPSQPPLSPVTGNSPGADAEPNGGPLVTPPADPNAGPMRGPGAPALPTDPTAGAAPPAGSAPAPAAPAPTAAVPPPGAPPAAPTDGTPPPNPVVTDAVINGKKPKELSGNMVPVYRGGKIQMVPEEYTQMLQGSDLMRSAGTAAILAGDATVGRNLHATAADMDESALKQRVTNIQLYSAAAQTEAAKGNYNGMLEAYGKAFSEYLPHGETAEVVPVTQTDPKTKQVTHGLRIVTKVQTDNGDVVSNQRDYYGDPANHLTPQDQLAATLHAAASPEGVMGVLSAGAKVAHDYAEANATNVNAKLAPAASAAQNNLNNSSAGINKLNTTQGTIDPTTNLTPTQVSGLTNTALEAPLKAGTEVAVQPGSTPAQIAAAASGVQGVATSAIPVIANKRFVDQSNPVQPNGTTSNVVNGKPAVMPRGAVIPKSGSQAAPAPVVRKALPGKG